MNDAPLSGLLSTEMLPPNFSIMLADLGSPNPGPVPVGFAVERGSKICLRFSSGMPGPVSATVEALF